MNDFLLIFMGIFILLLILLIFILLAYVYHTYTTYTIDINKNLETSETNINNTSNAFNKLQDNIVNELAKVNKNQETIIKTVPDNLNSLNSNLLDIFNLKDNENKAITDITKSKINVDSINIVKPFTSYKNISVISDKDNYFTICNSKSGINNACVRMNIDDSDMFNIYTCNITKNNNNIKGINIYDSNNNVLASFDQFNRKILLGSGSDSTAAIKIIDNVYTPDVIICKYKCYPQAASAPKITLQFVSNFPIKKNTFINFPIINNFTIPTGQQQGDPSYINKILKFKVVDDSGISANTITIKEINITLSSTPATSMDEATTNGYITLS
jgi:hypothetical protein